MPRKVIPLLNGEIYHVYNRGSDKRVIFKDKKDYLRFYQSFYLFNSIEPVINIDHARVLFRNTPQKLVDIYAYALLPNHYHLILKQLVEGGISEFMKRISGGYTSYFNERHERSGVLFQGTYKRVHIENQEQFNYVFSYVNENHYVHGVKREEEVFATSSYHHQGKMKSKVISFKTDYSHKEAKRLAESIARKRNVVDKAFLIE